MSPLMLPRASRRLRILASVVVVMLITIGSIVAQFATFEEGFEGEIWELLHPDLELPPDVVNGNWASGVAWLNQELIVVDNYSGKASKFNSNLQLVDTSGADWNGTVGTPSDGWHPNEATAAKLEVNSQVVDIVLASDCTYNGSPSSSRVLAFLADGTHQFTIRFPEQLSGPAYTPCLNGVAMGPGAYFKLSGSSPTQTLELVGDFAVAWPERNDLESGGALIYRGDNTPSTATFVLNDSVFEASQPNWFLTGGPAESGDPSIPAVKAVTGITFDSVGNFFMVDSWTGRLHGYQKVGATFVHRFAFGTPTDPDDEGSTSLELPEAYGMTLWPSVIGDRLLITVPVENRAVVYRPTFSVGGDLENVTYLFKLDGLGAVSGLPHSSAFDPLSGRVALSDSGNNTVKVFQTPALAVFDLKVTQAGQAVSSVCRADPLDVTFSLTVPEGRSALQRVKPVLLVDGDASNVEPTPAGDYEPTVDGEVGTVNDPLNPRDVITYTYALTAPNTPGVLDLTGFATAFTTTTGGNGEFAQITNVLGKTIALAVADCAGNQPPTVVPELLSSTSVFGAPTANGWRKVEPVAPAAMLFTVRLSATDADGGIRQIKYQLNGINSAPEQTHDVPPLPDGSFPSTVTIDVDVIGEAEASQENPETLPGSTVVTFSALDNNFRPSTPGTLPVRLDNSLPNICFTVPYGSATAKTPGEFWWNGAVTIPVSVNDAQGPTPGFVAPIPAEVQGSTLVFSLEGSGQVATMVVEDHVGHQRILPSNTTLDVCGGGRTGALVNIDLTIPTIAADLAAGSYQDGQMFTLTAADPLAGTSPRANDGFSGIRRIEHSYDGFATAPIVTNGATAVIELTGSVTIHYRSVDWAGNVSATASRTFIVNHPPVAAADAYGTTEDTPLVVGVPGVLGNDSDADSNPLTAILVSGPSHGVLTLNAGGSFTYTPGANFNGTDSFTYRAHDGSANSNTAQVTISVAPVSDPPDAVNDFASTAYQTPVVIAVLANDSAGDGGTVTIQSIHGEVGGTATANPNGTVTFTPASGFSGMASFSYTIGDGGSTDTATVTVTVGPSNAAPICTAARTSADLWPPNHHQVYVTVSGVVDPEGQPIAVTFNSILQDEPTNSVGQGNTMQDGGIEQGGTRAWVRAERSGTNKVPGDGRVYLIAFTARDAGGLTCTGTVRVDVPHDKRGTPAVLSPGRWDALTGQLITPP